MKALLNRRTIIILSTALLLAVISIVSVNVFNSSGPVTGVANVITTPVKVLATTVARTFNRIFSAMYEYDQLVARNDELVRRLAEMEIAARESEEIKAENDMLRALLEFRRRYGEQENEQAQIENWTSDNWTSTFVINKGYSNSTAEITPGMGVVTEYGTLVGQLYDVGPTKSTVITTLDTRFSASVYVGKKDTGDDPGVPIVARGDFGHMGSGLLVLDQIDESIIVRKTDVAVTSGHGGVFPPGLIIGEVQETQRNASGIGWFATVSPMVNFDTLNDVFIITGFDVVE